MRRGLAVLALVALAACGSDADGDGESAAAPLCPAFACPDGAEPACRPSNLGPVENCRCSNSDSITRHTDGRTMIETFHAPFLKFGCLPSGRTSLRETWDETAGQTVGEYWDGDGIPTDFETASADRCRAWAAEGVQLDCD